MTETINAFQMAQSQFDHVAGLLNLDPQVAEMLRWPSREFKFMIPVKMDDGNIRVFFGYRVQHSDVRGPAKGGGEKEKKAREAGHEGMLAAFGCSASSAGKAA